MTSMWLNAVAEMFLLRPPEEAEEEDDEVAADEKGPPLLKPPDECDADTPDAPTPPGVGERREEVP